MLSVKSVKSSKTVKGVKTVKTFKNECKKSLNGSLKVLTSLNGSLNGESGIKYNIYKKLSKSLNSLNGFER